jgi:hypothetical protein
LLSVVSNLDVATIVMGAMKLSFDNFFYPILRTLFQADIQKSSVAGSET